MTSSNSNYLPKAASQNTITLGIRASTYEILADKIQSIAPFFFFSIFYFSFIEI